MAIMLTGVKQMDANNASAANSSTECDGAKVGTAWRPIESAPREGDEILIARCARQTALGGVWVMHVAWYDCHNGRWRTIGAEGLVEPTHWQPLPEPPR